MNLLDIVRETFGICVGSFVFVFPVWLAWWLSDGFACLRATEDGYVEAGAVDFIPKYVPLISPTTGRGEMVLCGPFGPLWYPT